MIRPSPRRILFGSDEPIFNALPERVLGNLRSPTSENALLWNLIYPLAQPKISLLNLLRKRPIWGTSSLPETGDEELIPYFWGYSIDGDRLRLLDVVLEDVDGPGLKTEVDLLLLGEQNLVVVEAKHVGGLGRCARFMNRRCPEIHLQADGHVDGCRYWEDDFAYFGSHLDFGPRPEPGEQSPPCHHHYQLARTLLVGYSLSMRLELQLHLWLIVPRNRWRSFERSWQDFTERVRDDDLWRRLRVIAWEDVRELRSDLFKRV
ncbi:MAG: hypothetical protein AMJ88_18950 [Anaerolineae bacterium SM23_ 63]|nr:MAG: hypothetical protein AMJ88_18950 [Anaerolineae bacterium SM23_ 63]